MSDTPQTSPEPTSTEETPDESTTITFTPRIKRWLKVAAASTGAVALVAAGYMLGQDDDEDSDEDSEDDGSDEDSSND